MSTERKYIISSATYLYDNSFLILNEDGETIPELSGEYSEDKLNEIIKNSDNLTSFSGFEKLRCIACDIKNGLIFKKN